MKWVFFALLLLVSVACFRKKKNVPLAQATCGTAFVEENRNREGRGSTLFKVYCSTCHSYDQTLTGPALQGFVNRVPNEHWMRVYLTNFDSLAQSGDSTFVYWQKWSPAHCVVKKGLTPKQVDDLIYYIKD